MHHPQKVEFVTVCGFEREFQFAVIFDLSLCGPAVSRVANNVAALRGTCKILKFELSPLHVLQVVSRPNKLRRLHQ